MINKCYCLPHSPLHIIIVNTSFIAQQGVVAGFGDLEIVHQSCSALANSLEDGTLDGYSDLVPRPFLKMLTCVNGMITGQ